MFVRDAKCRLRENNKTRTVGRSFSDQTHYMLKIFSRKPDRCLYVINKSRPEQNFNSKLKIKEIVEENKLLHDYENAIIVFDDSLGTSSNKFMNQLFIRGRCN